MTHVFFGCRIHFKNGRHDRVHYFNTPEESQAFFDSKKKEYKAALEGLNEAFAELHEADQRENVFVIADTMTYYEDSVVVMSFEDAFFPA